MISTDSLIMVGNTQGKNSDAIRGGLLQYSLGAGTQRSPCGEHIVNQKQVLSFKCSFWMESESLTCVFPPLDTLFTRLRLSVCGANNAIPFNWNARHIRDALSNTDTLIVSTLTQPFRVQRHRKQAIYPIEEALAQQ